MDIFVDWLRISRKYPIDNLLKLSIIPKKMRVDLEIKKGTRLLINEERDRIIIRPVTVDEKHLMMLLSETSLKKVWDNPYDERWDDVLQIKKMIGEN